MDKALYVTMTGATAALRAQSSVAHNLANISTTGFKADLVQTGALPISGIGFPTRVNATLNNNSFDNSAGPILQTGGDLDLAFGENKWLAVQDSTGGEAYTRAGALKINSNGQLLTASGQAVVGEGGPIAIPPYQKISIGNDGTISIVPQGQGPETQATVGRLRVVEATASRLQRGEDGLMRTAGNETLPAAAGTVLMSGAIEGSNVDAAQSLVDMIELSRQFEMHIRMLHNVDENARASSSLLRLG